MSIERAHAIVEDYKFHTWLIRHILEGMTHEESVVPLPFETNSMNWVVGHIVTNRSHALEVAGVKHDWQDAVRELYHTGTPSIKPEDKAVRLENLLTYLDESARLLQDALENVSEEWLGESFTNYRGEKTREAHLSGFHWHESFHIGQLEIFKDFVLSIRKSKS